MNRFDGRRKRTVTNNSNGSKASTRGQEGTTAALTVHLSALWLTAWGVLVPGSKHSFRGRDNKCTPLTAMKAKSPYNHKKIAYH